MRIANKISFAFLAGGICFTVISLSIFYFVSRQSLETAIYNHLETTLQSRVDHISTYLSLMKASMEELSRQDFVRNFLDRSGDNTENISEVIKELRHTEEINGYFYELFLLDAMGKVVAATNESDIGIDKSKDDFFTRGRNKTYIKDAYYFQPLNKYFIVISTPVLENETKRLLGVAAVRIELNYVYDIISNTAGLGRTGEMYLVNKSGYMISPSRFLKNTFLKQKIDSLNLKMAQMHTNEKHVGKAVNIFLNYRGEKVLGTHAYLPEVKWFVFGEIETQEALSPLKKIKVFFAIISIMVLPGAWLAGAFFANLIVRPIIKLRKGMEIVGAGNLDYRLNLEYNDEIGQLSSSFDAMTERLKTSTTSITRLNQEVERTRKIERALRESEERFRGAFETSAIGMALVGLDGKWLKVNNSLCDIIGYSEEELMEKSFQDITYPEDLETGLDYMRRVISGEIPHYHMEKRYVHKDGRIIWILLSVSLVRGEDNQPLYFISQIEDITERKRAEEKAKKYTSQLESLNDRIRITMNELQERDQRLLDASEELRSSLSEVEYQRELALTQRNRLEAIIHSIGEAIFVINEKREIELMNEKAIEIFGFSQTGELSEGYKKLFIMQLWKELHDAGQEIIKKEIKIERPREVILVATLTRLSRAKTEETGFVAVLRDVTEERRIEQMKSDFVANVSHEIRSPMAPMKDALNLVLDETTGPLNAQQKRFLSLVDNNIRRLVRLINDLLDLSKIEAGRLELKREYNDLTSLLKDTVDSIRSYAEGKKIKLFFDTQDIIPRIIFDKDRITQVVINLVTNAIKFTPEYGEIFISLKGTYSNAKELNSVEFLVKDSGPGMSAEEADGLFNRFKQLVSTERVKGTGLGLAISKAIIEMHGGRIWVESEIGKGSVFKFSLPVITE